MSVSYSLEFCIDNQSDDDTEIDYYSNTKGSFSFWLWMLDHYPSKVKFLPPIYSPESMDDIPIDVINFSEITSEILDSYGFYLKDRSDRLSITYMFERAGIFLRPHSRNKMLNSPPAKRSQVSSASSVPSVPEITQPHRWVLEKPKWVEAYVPFSGPFQFSAPEITQPET
jgi:hypothetical protein